MNMKTGLGRFELICLITVWIIQLSPYLGNGFWQDDAFNSSIWGEVHRHQSSLWNFIESGNFRWMFENGRFFPLSWITGYTLFYFIRPLEVFRLIQVILVGANALLFASLLRREGLPNSTVRLFLVLLPLFFQLRTYHDPIASYGFIIQIVFLFFWASHYCLSRYICHSEEWILAVISSLVIFLALAYYELSLCFIPFYFISLFKCTSFKKGLERFWIVLAPLIVYFIIVVYLRSRTSQVYAGISWGHGSDIVKTTFRQISAAVPLSNSFFNSPSGLIKVTLWRSVTDSKIGWTLFVMISLLVYRARSWSGDRPDVRRNYPQMVLFLGVGLILFPSLMIGFSARYQSEINWGVGYLPVYISYFGFALLSAIGLERLIQNRSSLNLRLKRLSFLVIALFIGTIGTLSWGLNRIQAHALDRHHRLPYLALTGALSSGVLSHTTDGDILWLKNTPPWFNAAFIYQFAGKRLTLAGVPDTSFFKIPPLSPQGVFHMDFKVDDEDHFYVQVNRLGSDPNLRPSDPMRDICATTTDQIRIFARAQIAPRANWIHLNRTGEAAEFVTRPAPPTDSGLRWLYGLSHTGSYFELLKSNFQVPTCGLQVRTTL